MPLTSDPAQDRPGAGGQRNVATIIWTTTPWTLPASMAVTFAPDAEYVALDTGEWIYIVAKELAQQTIEKCNLGDAEGAGALSRARSWSTRPSRIPSSIAQSSACSATTSPWIPVRARCTPLRRTAPMTSSPA